MKFILLILVALAIFWMIPEPSHNPPAHIRNTAEAEKPTQAPPRKGAATAPDRTEILVVALAHVRSQLAAPARAEFTGIPEVGYVAADQRASVMGTVDAPSSGGGKARQDYSIIMRHTCDAGAKASPERCWHVEGLIIGDQVKIDNALNATSTTGPISAPAASVGDRGKLAKGEITELQRTLAKRGYDVGKPDGIWGARTTRAVEEFKKDAGIAADAAIDSRLIERIRRR